MISVKSDFLLFLHKRYPIFDEAPFLYCKQFVPVIILPVFYDKVYSNYFHFPTNWALAA